MEASKGNWEADGESGQVHVLSTVSEVQSSRNEAHSRIAIGSGTEVRVLVGLSWEDGALEDIPGLRIAKNSMVVSYNPLRCKSTDGSMDIVANMIRPDAGAGRAGNNQ